MLSNTKALRVMAKVTGLAMGALMAASPVLAQQPRPAAPAQRPAQPAAPAQAAPAQPQGPVKVDLQPSQTDWTKVCGKDEAANKEICYTTRDFGQAADQPPVLAVAVYDVKGDDKRIMRFLLPVALMLKPGFRFTIDNGKAESGQFAICFPNGCFAEAEINGATINTLKRATTLNVAVRNQVNNEVTFSIPMKDFSKSFDGAPIDPAVLEQQQKQLQEQLQRRAEDERKRLEAQPGAPAAPAPAPAPR